LFDCDGVILETEELHRLAYNEAFREFDLKIDGVPLSWSVRAF
jgi:beta-phosphoglucomutase-like phosphatase (HAD superfamily)